MELSPDAAPLVELGVRQGVGGGGDRRFVRVVLGLVGGDAEDALDLAVGRPGEDLRANVRPDHPAGHVTHTADALDDLAVGRLELGLQKPGQHLVIGRIDQMQGRIGLHRAGLQTQAVQHRVGSAADHAARHVVDVDQAATERADFGQHARLSQRRQRQRGTHLDQAHQDAGLVAFHHPLHLDLENLEFRDRAVSDAELRRVAVPQALLDSAPDLFRRGAAENLPQRMSVGLHRRKVEQADEGLVDPPRAELAAPPVDERKRHRGGPERQLIEPGAGGCVAIIPKHE